MCDDKVVFIQLCHYTKIKSNKCYSIYWLNRKLKIEVAFKYSKVASLLKCHWGSPIFKTHFSLVKKRPYINTFEVTTWWSSCVQVTKVSFWKVWIQENVSGMQWNGKEQSWEREFPVSPRQKLKIHYAQFFVQEIFFKAPFTR